MDDSTKQRKTLRLIICICLITSLCLAIPFAVHFGGCTPAFGLIFLILSCVLARADRPRGSSLLRRLLFGAEYEYRIVLGNDPDTQDEDQTKPANGNLLLIGDICLAVAHALLFSFTIAELATSWWYRDHAEILGTFASLPYLTAFIAHSILATEGVCKLARDARIQVVRRCPHCHKTTEDEVVDPATVRVVSEEGDATMSGGSGVSVVSAPGHDFRLEGSH